MSTLFTCLISFHISNQITKNSFHTRKTMKGQSGLIKKNSLKLYTIVLGEFKVGNPPHKLCLLPNETCLFQFHASHSVEETVAVLHVRTVPHTRWRPGIINTNLRFHHRVGFPLNFFTEGRNCVISSLLTDDFILKNCVIVAVCFH